MMSDLTTSCLAALRRSEELSIPLTTARIAATTAVTGGGSGIEPAAARWGSLRRRRVASEPWSDAQFCVLRRSVVLYFFASEKATAPTCAVDCLGMSVRANGNELGCEFELVGDVLLAGDDHRVRDAVPQKVELRARTAASREDWMVSLRDAMKFEAQFGGVLPVEVEAAAAAAAAATGGGGGGDGDGGGLEGTLLSRGFRRSTTTLDLEGKLQEKLRRGDISKEEYAHITRVHAESRAPRTPPPMTPTAARDMPWQRQPQPGSLMGTPVPSPPRKSMPREMEGLDAKYLEQMLGKMNKMKRQLASETAKRKAATAAMATLEAGRVQLEADVRRLGDAQSNLERGKMKVDLLLADLQAQLKISERARRDLERELETSAGGGVGRIWTSWKSGSIGDRGRRGSKDSTSLEKGKAAAAAAAAAAAQAEVQVPRVNVGSVLRQSMQRKLDEGLISQEEFNHMVRVAGEASHIDKLEQRLQMYERSDSESEDDDEEDAGSAAAPALASTASASASASTTSAGADQDDSFGSNQSYVDSLHHMIKTTNQKWYARWKKATDRVAELESALEAAEMEEAEREVATTAGGAKPLPPSPIRARTVSSAVGSSERVALATEIERVQEIAARYEAMMAATLSSSKKKKKKKKVKSARIATVLDR